MLFNSYVFIFAFLPLTILVFYFLSKNFHKIAILWLVVASLFFYAWWNPIYVGLLLSSIAFNYSIGLFLSNSDNIFEKKVLLSIGILANIGLLVYYKYADFFISNLNIAFDSNYSTSSILLPLAISFFTFQQIAYLVDTFKKETEEHNFLHYCLFVTFFPQLIAGPIVHHKEMLPQFSTNISYRLTNKNIAIGSAIFIVGLFKKVVMADGIAVYASPVFSGSETGVVLTFFEAWIGALSYTFQLYFDFSGYSDMAVGIAAMFGILLPLNFNSPYKAKSIIEFWQRWHITLSRFLKDYLYIPLGGNRKGNVRRYSNLLVTMLLGGLWHGAGWTFIIWGGLHGIYLVINHVWKQLHSVTNISFLRIPSLVSKTITIFCVIVGWVFFRSSSIDSALSILKSMFTIDRVSLPSQLSGQWMQAEKVLVANGVSFDGMFKNTLFDPKSAVIWVLVLMIITFSFPNTQEFIARQAKQKESKYIKSLFSFRWEASLVYSLLMSLVAIISLLWMAQPSEFLYFQF